MTYAILFCVGSLLLVASRYIYNRYLEIYLCLLIILNFEFFYLLPQISGSDNYKILLITMLSVNFLEIVFKGDAKIGRYGIWLAMYFILIMGGVVVAYFAGQDILLGIKAAKFSLLLLVYFLLQGRKLDTELFIKYFIFLGIAVAFLATLQYIFIDSITLFAYLPKGYLAERFGHTRFISGELVIAVGAVAAFVKYRKKSGVIYLIFSLLLLAETIVVQKTRMLIAAEIGTMCFVFILLGRNIPIRILMTVMLIIFLGAAYSAVPDINIKNVEMVNLTKSDITKGGSSFTARINAYKYYWGKFIESPLYGHGILNFNWVENRESRLQAQGIHFADIGLMHLLFKAGIIGVIWFIYGFLKIWKDTLHNRTPMEISSYFILATLAAPTIDMFLRVDSLFLFSLFAGVFSITISDIYYKNPPEFKGNAI